MLPRIRLRAMSNSFSLALLTVAVLAVSSCASSVVQDESRYFGCYALNGHPALTIEAHRLSDMSGHKNALRGFTKLRDSDYVQVRNRMHVDEGGRIAFALEDTGYHYEFKRAPEITLIVYDDRGQEFDLVRTGSKCL